MPYPRILPDDSLLLRERDFEGLTLEEIAAKHNVSKAAVSKAFTRMGRPFGSHAAMDFKEIIPWSIQRPHQSLDASVRLRAHIKFRSGLEVPESAKRRLENWWLRMRDERTVLTYREDASPFWHYVPRKASDGNMIVRWPEDMPPPTDRQRSLLTLPA
jgi:hypothetical protein